MSETNPKSIEATETEGSKSAANRPEPKTKNKSIVPIIVLVLLLIGLIVGLVFLAKADVTVVSQVRDIFIILMALMMFVIGVALVVLIIQLANLTNLLQHEIKPILNSTTDTVNTLKGTVRFLSDNVSEPVIKLNESLASIHKLLEIFRLKR